METITEWMIISPLPLLKVVPDNMTIKNVDF